MNCSTHASAPSVAKCAYCGAELCQECHDHFVIDETTHLCPVCYKAAIEEEIDEIKPVKKKVVWELISIILGILAGIGFAFYVAWGDTTSTTLELVLGFVFFAFLGGSIVPILKRLGAYYKKHKKSRSEELHDLEADVRSVFHSTPEEDRAFWIRFIRDFFIYVFVPALIFAVFVAIAPITTTVRLILRIVDIFKLNALLKQGGAILAYVDAYVERSHAPISALEDGAELGESFAEIAKDAVQLFDNDEMLKVIESR